MVKMYDRQTFLFFHFANPPARQDPPDPPRTPKNPKNRGFWYPPQNTPPRGGSPQRGDQILVFCTYPPPLNQSLIRGEGGGQKWSFLKNFEQFKKYEEFENFMYFSYLLCFVLLVCFLFNEFYQQIFFLRPGHWVDKVNNSPTHFLGFSHKIHEKMRGNFHE